MTSRTLSMDAREEECLIGCTDSKQVAATVLSLSDGSHAKKKVS